MKKIFLFLSMVLLTSCVTSERFTQLSKAITAKGTQCSRNASPGSDYCWQHQKKSSDSSISPSISSDKNIITGPRGGQYYINKNGNKTYVRKRK